MPGAVALAMSEVHRFYCDKPGCKAVLVADSFEDLKAKALEEGWSIVSVSEAEPEHNGELLDVVYGPDYCPKCKVSA